MSDAAQILGPDGRFAEQVPGFRARLEQQQMASAVEQILTRDAALLVEAGTGTGKTFAYLVPALLSGKKLLISTGTKNLQDQLFNRDLPLVRQALGLPVQLALLKGRSNYLCRLRLEQQLDSGQLQSRQLVSELRQVKLWSARTRTGDLAELNELAEDAPILPHVTSTNDNCLGQECGHYQNCYLVQARRAALDAEVVVVNHHLFFADMSIKDQGFGELLPAVQAVIFDEAHQLPEVASLFFGESVSSRQLLELGRDLELLADSDLLELPELSAHCLSLKQQVETLRADFGANQQRALWGERSQPLKARLALGELNTLLLALAQMLEPFSVKSKAAENLWRRSIDLQLNWQKLTAEPLAGQVHWYETYRTGFSVQITPLNVAQVLGPRFAEAGKSWIFTSATLAVGRDFEHFSAELGLVAPDCLKLDSPFDYPRQALWYNPRGLPDPSSPDYNERLLEAALPVLRASRGRAFFLFTSHKALQQIAMLLRGRLPYPLLVQGEMSKGALLAEFRLQRNAILLGTASFWEGIDVQGQALSCVIIDRLPFGSPGDPVMRARIDAVRRSGEDPFQRMQLPQAVIALKQGAGRLIRGIDDQGVLMIADPRLVARPYGQLFVQSLPPMGRTRSLERICQFFAELDRLQPEVAAEPILV